MRDELATNGSFDSDVVIIGGGPAGTAAALSLRQHAPSLTVTLVEQNPKQSARMGETLSPAARPLLLHLRLFDAFQQQAHVTSVGTRSTWGTSAALNNQFVFSARGDGWHLDRRRFDRLLVDTCRGRGVVVLEPTRVESAARDGGKGAEWPWQLAVRLGDNTQRSIRTRFVVDATGRRAWFARKYGGATPLVKDRLIAAFMFFQFPLDGEACDTLTRVEAGESHWWYAAALPARKAAVACFTDSDIAAELRLHDFSAWSRLLRTTVDVSAFLRTARPLGEPRLHAAQSQLLDHITGKDWLAVGDAASTWDPLSSLGVFKALRSGTFAAYAISEYFAGKAAGLNTYRRQATMEFESYLKIRARYYGEVSHWPESAFWNRRRQSIAANSVE